MNPRIGPLCATLSLNTRLFLNALDGVSDTVFNTRPNDHVNHMAFIALHLLDARHYLAEFTGRPTDKPFRQILEGASTIEDIKEFPKMKEVTAAWDEISNTLGEHLEKIEEKLLSNESPQAFPIEDPTILGGIAFLVEHESHHIGQLAYLRRYFDLPPMKWT